MAAVTNVATSNMATLNPNWHPLMLKTIKGPKLTFRPHHFFVLSLCLWHFFVVASFLFMLVVYVLFVCVFIGLALLNHAFVWSMFFMCTFLEPMLFVWVVFLFFFCALLDSCSSFVLLGLCSSFALIGMCFSFMLSLGFMFFYRVIIVPFLYDVSIFFLRTIIALPLRCVHIFPSHYYCPSFTMCPYFSFAPLLCLSSMLHPCFFFHVTIVPFVYNMSILFICVTFILLMHFFHSLITYVFYMCANVAFVLVLHANVMPFLCVLPLHSYCAPPS